MSENKYVVWNGPDGRGSGLVKDEDTKKTLLKPVTVKLPQEAGGFRLTSARPTLVTDETIEYLKRYPKETYVTMNEAEVKKIQEKATKTEKEDKGNN